MFGVTIVFVDIPGRDYFLDRSLVEGVVSFRIGHISVLDILKSTRSGVEERRVRDLRYVGADTAEATV